MIAITTQVAHQIQQLTETPGLLLVHTKFMAEQLCMVVYRSVALKLQQELYAPIARFLSEYEHEQIEEIEFTDPVMIRKRGIETTYAIYGRKEDPSTNLQLESCA